AMEFERLLTSAGPTGGEIIKPSDGKHPKSIVFVLCVGSRDRHFYRYCSRFCCMYSVKHAFQALDHGVEDATVMYMDLRSYGKGFDAFWERTRQEGAHFVRGLPGEIMANGKGLSIRYENTETGALETKDTDMVVLATAVRPPDGLADLAGVLDIEVDEDGFLTAVETRGGLITTTRPGVYAAGCASGPKDIPDSVAEAGAAAAATLTHIGERTWPEEEHVEGVSDERGEPRIGVFVCHCGSNIAGVVDIPQVVDYSRTLPGVIYSQSQMFSCAGNTQQEIVEAIRDQRLNRVVVAACSPKTHEPTFRRVLNKAGLNPFLLEMVNLRNQDSWVHKERHDEATLKAFDMVRMGVQKAALLEPLQISQQPMVQAALVIGGGVAGMAAASNLARQGYETHLIEKESRLGGLLADLDELAPSGVKARQVLEAQSQEVWRSEVKVHLGTQVEVISGHIGNFTATLSTEEEIRAGAVIVATGATPYQPTEFGYGTDPGVITNLELESAMEKPPGDRVTFVACVGSRRNGAGCSRYCCESMIGQALRLRQAGKKVRVLYREIRTFSRHAEELYEEASRAGVQFIKYAPDVPPEEALRFEDGHAIAHDALTDVDVRVPTDLLVLTVGLQPTEDNLSEQLKLAHSEDGFLLERHPKLGPVEAGSPGIFICGTAQAPKDVRESVAQGMAAAAKSAILLARD
ncbi:MAG: FAD-dependent oxidoreductase, partial [Dehalococcoidia bacterium]